MKGKLTTGKVNSSLLSQRFEFVLSVIDSTVEYHLLKLNWIDEMSIITVSRIIHGQTIIYIEKMEIKCMTNIEENPNEIFI